jgi:Tol biopolymer transport system component
MKILRMLTAGLALTLLLCTPAMAQTGHDLFQQALVKEQAEGDLRAAIGLYQRIVNEFAADRSLAARALVQMGQCHERLGNQEAEAALAAYRQVLEEYADQPEPVEQARTRLAALEQPAETDMSTISTSLVWSGPGASASDPTPDGKFLVYRDLMDTRDLALREIATGETRYLTGDARNQPDMTNAYNGRVSPDGTWVAHGFSIFDRDGTPVRGSLRVVGMDGRNLRVLLEEEGCWLHAHDWTSDGQWIAGRWDCWPDLDAEGEHRLVLVSAMNGGMRVLHQVSGTGYAQRSWVSPDDRYLVYDGPVEQDGGNRDIWILPLAGGDPLSLLRHPADDRVLGWVPNTDFVVFLSDRDGTWDLWAGAVRDGRMAEPLRKIWRNMGEVDPAGLSGDGSLFYSRFTRWCNTSIAPFDLAMGRTNLVAAMPLLGSNRSPQWSPDGRRLAFVSESEVTEGKYGRINIRDLTTGEQDEVATDLQARFILNWSPDGRSLLVSGDDGRDEPHFWKVDANSGDATPLLPVPDAYEWWGGWTWAAWSPDGGSLLYSVMNDGEGRSRLIRRDLASGGEEELYRDSVILRRPFELSPDGHQVAFVFMDSLNAEMPGGIATLDLDTGASRRLVAFGDSLAEWEVSIHWAPDGEDILYSEIVQGAEQEAGWHTNVLRVPAAGGEPELLWTFAEGKFSGGFELSPDGSRVALTTFTQERGIWVMEGLRDVLRSWEER